MGAIRFLDYDKISDTLMYFSQYVSLNFCVGLSRKNNQGELVHFHSEYTYNANNLGKKGLSIKRSINAYFAINDVRDFKNSVIIRPQDIVMLQMVFNNNIIPWLIGNKRIYGFDGNNKLIIKGKWSPVDFPISDYKYIAFMPIVIDYEDGTSKEGIRFVINDSNNFIDIDINKFMEFYYYMCNTDIYNAAIGLLNYVKTGPYGENLVDMQSDNRQSNNDFGDWEDAKKDGGKKSNFFDRF